MELIDVWPLFGLSIRTPRLELRVLRDEHLPGLVDAALAGVHDPALMPFGVPWTDAPAEELPAAFATYHWSRRAPVTPDSWNVSFTVLLDDRPVGIQELHAWKFPTLRTVGTGSWLTRSVQGRGLGTEMRAGLLAFAFDVLGAEWAESSAASWNGASLGVSRRLGYVENGVARVESRPGRTQEEQRMRLAATAFNRPDWPVRMMGAERARDQLLGPAGGSHRPAANG